FFFSGFPALLYQIVWQRALFTIYGVNIESVTVIVTVFMLGLGLGSLGGVWGVRACDVCAGGEPDGWAVGGGDGAGGVCAPAAAYDADGKHASSAGGAPSEVHA